MADSPDNSTDEQPEFLLKERAEHAARVKAATEQFGAAMKEYVAALRAQSWALGWDKGFDDGWAEASKHFAAAAEGNRRSRIAPTPPPQIELLPLTSAVQEGANSNEKVLAFIEAHPGLRGVEIAQRLAGIMLERTVRTALHRLRDKKVRNVKGKWYTIAAAPEQEVP